jgi:hypothetical protein
MPDAPQPPDLATRLDEMADEMAEFPNMRTTSDEIALIRKTSERIRELELEIGSLVVAVEYLTDNISANMTCEQVDWVRRQMIATIRHANDCLAKGGA